MEKDLYNSRTKLPPPHSSLHHYSLQKLSKQDARIEKLPLSIRILLENALRKRDGFSITDAHIESLLDWEKQQGKASIPFTPGRVLMQDFTGVPAVVDLASIRSELARKKKDISKINPVVPVDIVIDHSVQVEYFGTTQAYTQNVALEYARNKERYVLLKWAQQAFRNFNTVPPGMGICHQVNLEYLAKVVLTDQGLAYPDTLVGTDSHTPMVNGLGVLGWGVGGIEAEAAMLGQPLYMGLPEVIGIELKGKLPEGSTSTDLVLTITRLLRDYGVVGKFVELLGEGLSHLTVADRATISNMSPEFGCTNTHWPVDEQTLTYLEKTGRSKEHVSLVECYAKENLLWKPSSTRPAYTDVISLDLGQIRSTISGPKRPQDKILLHEAKEKIIAVVEKEYSRKYIPPAKRHTTRQEGNGHWYSVPVQEDDISYHVSDASIAIAAITSCTNTSNPSVMLGAGLVAKKAVERGLHVKPWVKTSLAPGSRVVTRYLKKGGLMPYLEALGFHVVGYGCTTCIGNSGDMAPHIQELVRKHELIVASVLSGNRNFEARIHPQVKMNFLASPMLVVAYALAGRMDVDMLREPLGKNPEGEAVYLRDIWPAQAEINAYMEEVLSQEDYKREYAHIFEGDGAWKALEAPQGNNYEWDEGSSYIQEAPFFKGMQERPVSKRSIRGARVLLQLGDMVTTDHISPAGKFEEEHPAGTYLVEKGVRKKDFNSYGSRRGNHEVMVRGTFANVRIRNKIATQEGGYTTHFPSGEKMSVHEAAMRYQKDSIPLIVIGGKEYGSGSSRDWAAKGTALLGVKAVIAESFERIHRSNLVGMGVLPLTFRGKDNQSTLDLQGDERYDIMGLEKLSPGAIVQVQVHREGKDVQVFEAIVRLDSAVEVAYYEHDGILPYVIRSRFLGNGK